jgi:hypothetical protein
MERLRSSYGTLVVKPHRRLASERKTVLQLITKCKEYSDVTGFIWPNDGLL